MNKFNIDIDKIKIIKDEVIDDLFKLEYSIDKFPKYKFSVMICIHSINMMEDGYDITNYLYTNAIRKIEEDLLYSQRRRILIEKI